MSGTGASREWFRRAKRCIPGGVSSPVRAFRAVGGDPIVFAKGSGPEITDVDGRRFLDFVGSWGPLILGHAHPEVVEAISDASRHGTTFGAPCRAEIELAELVVDSYPGIEAVRFVSSGTEATMSAIRLARGVTGRDRIIKFAGCYHGHADHLLVAAGSGLTTFGRPDSAGVPADFASLTQVLDLDDEDSLEATFSREGERIAAVIVEPMPANHGLLVQRREFLESLREQTRKFGALLIFDEVISGFRLGPDGAAGRYEITPDLVTFGKVIGGGLPVGAFAGPRGIMNALAPDGPVYQAGTLSGNPVAMAAGLATLRVLEASDGWRQLERLGQELEARLRPLLDAAPIPVQLVRQGSVFWLCSQGGPVPRSPRQFDPSGADRYRKVFRSLLERDIYLAPSAYEVGFLSLAHRESHLDELAAALEEALGEASRNA